MANAPTPDMTASQWGLLVLLAALWGGSFLFVGIAVRDLPPLTIVLSRVALAALVLLPIVLARGHRLPTTFAGWQPFLVMAVLNNVIPFSLIVTGQKEIASGLASVLNATTPVSALIVAHLFAPGERLQANKLAGVALGILGVMVLVGQDAIFGRASSVFGMLCILGATLSYGFSGLWGRRLRSHPPLLTAAAQLCCSTVVLMPLAALVEQPWSLALPRLDTIAAIIALAVLSTAMAYVVFFRIMAVSGSNNVMLVTLLIPVFAIPLGTIWLGEHLQVRHYGGAVVIGLSLLLIDGRLLRRRAAP
jgi:drug/metabolite transporter (DMT)-like permease